jgi:hypothetical protein
MTAELLMSNSKGNKDMPVNVPQLQQMPDILFIKGLQLLEANKLKTT